MPLPDEPWFRVRDAVADGYSRESLKSSRLETPFYGVRARAGMVANVEQVCRAYSTKIAPGSAFTGLTAARLWQLPLPAYVGFDFRTIDVASLAPRRSPRGIHVRGSQYDSRFAQSLRLRELPVLSAVDTWCSLGTIIDPMDLVAVADHLLAAHPDQIARCTLAELTEAVDRRRGMRGQRALEWALVRARPGSRSRTETLSRLVLTAVGLPEPVLNHRIVTPERRFFLDLAWPEFHFSLEYDGDQHREPRQFADDIRRQELIHDERWSMMRATKADLFDRTPELVRRVETRLRERGCHAACDMSHLVIPRR